MLLAITIMGPSRPWSDRYLFSVFNASQRLSTLFNTLQRDSTLEELAVLKRVEHLSAVTFRTSLEGRSTRSVGRELLDLKRSVRVHATLDELQAKIRPALKERGFRARGRAFNRTTSDGLTEVVQLQMGSFDPPGTAYIPGLRENLYGKFTVNLGVFVPEVAEHYGAGAPKSFVQEYHCCVRTRLAMLGPERRDVWWDIRGDVSIAQDLLRRITRDAMPFFRKFDTRDAILAQWLAVPKSPYAIAPPRIVCAIILAERGWTDDARALLTAQARETTNPGHPAYVRRLADKLGLGSLEL